jgi:hypothetical protein
MWQRNKKVDFCSTSTDIDFSTNIESNLIPLFLSSVSQHFQVEKQNKVFALLDTRSLAGNFIVLIKDQRNCLQFVVVKIIIVMIFRTL